MIVAGLEQASIEEERGKRSRGGIQSHSIRGTPSGAVSGAR